MADPATTSNSIGITILGHGTVGGGVVRILREQRELLKRRTGLSFEIRHVVVRNASKHADAAAEGARVVTGKTSEAPDTLPYTTDAESAIDDPRSQIIVELIGGS